MAELEAALRENTVLKGIKIERSDGKLVITMPADMLFASGESALDPEQQQTGKLAEEMLQGPFATVQIIGHTDNRGSVSDNQVLSERRAEAVAAVFVAHGWQRGLLHVMGRGASEPVASNDTEEGRILNRRVELVVLPNI